MKLPVSKYSLTWLPMRAELVPTQLRRRLFISRRLLHPWVNCCGRPRAHLAGAVDHPLLQNFVVNETGKQLAVIANHFKSKGSCPRDRNDANANQGDGQSCWNALRVETALELAAWLDTNPGDIEHNNFVLLGDFNSYKQEDPLTALAGVGYRNLAHDFDPDGYSYVFRGEKGSLDHVLVHESMLPAIIGMAHWYINSDEPIAFEYPLENKTEWQQSNWYAPTPYRSSDHDPILTVIDSTQLN